MNLGPLKDKRVQIAAGGAALLGVVVLLRKGTGSPSTSADDSSGSTITPANYDSTGTDVYNAIQAIGQGWSADLQGFTDQLGDIQTQLGQINGPTATTPASGTLHPVIPTKTTTPKKTTMPVPKAKPLTVKVAKYTTKNAPWNSTLSGIAEHYHTSTKALLKLNPSIKNPNVIHTGQTIRYK